VFGVLLSGSRTGMAGGVGLLMLWGLADWALEAFGFKEGRLSRGTRWMLILAPLVALVCWWGLDAWAHVHAARLRRQAAPRGEGSHQLARRDLAQHDRDDRAAALARRRLGGVQFRVDAHAVPRPPGGLLRPHARPAAAVDRRTRSPDRASWCWSGCSWRCSSPCGGRGRRAGRRATVRAPPG
jgi:hypothetical protein